MNDDAILSRTSGSEQLECSSLIGPSLRFSTDRNHTGTFLRRTVHVPGTRTGTEMIDSYSYRRQLHRNQVRAYLGTIYVPSTESGSVGFDIASFNISKVFVMSKSVKLYRSIWLAKTAASRPIFCFSDPRFSVIIAA